jgi:hypothetical protein
VTAEQIQGMPPSKLGMGDSVETAMKRVREAKENVPIGGNVIVELFGPDGALKHYEIGNNLVTDYGDEMVGERMYSDAFEIITGMKLGTGVTAADKQGAGGALVTYEPASEEALDATPIGVDKGVDLGWRVPFICTWVAGDVVEAALAEVVLTNETPLTDVTSVLLDTIARFVFGSTIDKQAGDELVVTWNVDFLGA